MRAITVAIVASVLLTGCSQDDKVVIPSNPAPLPTEGPQPFGGTPAAVPGEVTPAEK